MSVSPHLRTHLSLRPRTPVCLSSPVPACCNRAQARTPLPLAPVCWSRPCRRGAELAPAGDPARGVQPPGTPPVVWGQPRTWEPRSSAGGGEQGDLPFFPPQREGAATPSLGDWKVKEETFFSVPFQDSISFTLTCFTGPIWKGMKGKPVGEGAPSELADVRVSLHLLPAALDPRGASTSQSPRDFYLPVTTIILQNGETEGRFRELFHGTKRPVTAAEHSLQPHYSH